MQRAIKGGTQMTLWRTTEILQLVRMVQMIAALQVLCNPR